MQLKVREETLDIWRALVTHSYRDGRWVWGGRSGSNSISDAEQLLCLLYPATNVPTLRIDDPDSTATDVLSALRGLGDQFDILRVLTTVLTEYMRNYRDDDGHPRFSGGSYLEPFDLSSEPATTAEQSGLDIVDSFSMSITLCLSTLGFIQTLRGKVQSRTMVGQLTELEQLTADRLTAAMVGMLRSFSVNVFDIDSPPGRQLVSMVNQTGEPDRIVGERLARSLNDVRGSLRQELSIGSGQVSEELENPMRLFECGWSWGVLRDAPEVAEVKVGGQRPGVAQDRAYLYFTGVALDGIEDLFSERTRVLGLLNDEQQRLAAALQLRWDLCMRFWNRVATFGPERWPLEDVPWRTTDGVESDHFSLLLLSILVQRLHVRGVATPQAARLGAVLEELANRGRITRRPLAGDPAIAVHTPGTRLRLFGSESLGPLQCWAVSSYSSLLLKRSVQLAALAPETDDREHLSSLSDRIWQHLLDRRLTGRSGQGLWDQPGATFPVESPEYTEPSWYHTQRICECLVAAAGIIGRRVPANVHLVQLASEYLAEAEHLVDQELLAGTWSGGDGGADNSRHRAAQSITARLERARALHRHRPGTAVVLAQGVLAELDELAKARAHSLTEGLL
jgi:hypothetical protein